jgi:hypothetical protein
VVVVRVGGGVVGFILYIRIFCIRLYSIRYYNRHSPPPGHCSESVFGAAMIEREQLRPEAYVEAAHLC